MKRFKLVMIRVIHKLGHKAEHFFHMTYLGLVGWEAHGHYRFAAIALLIVVIANAIAGLSGEE